ncbi:MAG: LysM peptidoglycan-binding domain-containing protein [Alistipes sp.]|nr:LysM peptidoglycan-binding domain-containing protein [Alistipes sp.]
MNLFKRLITLAVFSTAVVGWAGVQALPPVEKTPVIVFINGKKYYIHTVKSGDTLYSIAKAYEVSEAVIKECNPGAADGLKIDQTIKIPVPEKVQAEARAEKKRKREYLSHKIKAGETLYGIARDYNISVATLMEDNPDVNPQALNVGKSLWVRKAEIGSSSEQEAKEDMAEYADNLNKATDDGYIYHVVMPGETIYSLARRYGITENEFVAMNDVDGGLKSGAVVRVPDPDRNAKEVAELAQAEAADQNQAEQNRGNVDVAFRSIPPSEPLDIALMLPLEVSSKPNASYVEFYQGFLLGLEHLKEEGRGAVNLTVYNTGHDQLKVKEIVDNGAFDATDLIVGPVYEDELKPVVDFAEKRGVPVVSPLANLSAVKSPVLYQLSPAPEKKYAKIGNLIDGGRDIYLIYASSNDSEFEREIIAELEGKSRYSYTYSYNQKSIFTPRDASSPAIADMADVLKGERPCLFIVLANAETDVDRILATISSANTSIVERGTKSAQYVVLGTSRWGRFNNIDHTSFFNNNVVMISTYHAKRDSAAVRDFDSRYIKSYGTLPSLYSYRGYDAAVIFGAGMRSDIDYRMLDKRYVPLQTEYKFLQSGENGLYVNQEWMRVNYNGNYTITLE